MIRRLTSAATFLYYIVQRRGPGYLLRYVAKHGLRSGIRAIADGSGSRGKGARAHRALDDHFQFLADHDAAWRSPPRDPKRAPFVAVIAELSLPQCRKFRVEQKVELLRQNDVACAYASHEDLPEALRLLQFASAVVLYRVPMSDNLLAILEEADRLGLRVGYDIDDPIFCKDAYRKHVNLDYLEGDLRLRLITSVRRFRYVFPLVHFFVASTPAIAQEIQTANRELGAATNRPCYLWRNLVDADAKAARDLAAPRPRDDDCIRIGFFSGSLAHEADFRLMLPALVALMQRDPRIDLLVGGYAQAHDLLAPLEDRVVREPFTSYAGYLGLIGEVDLVLVPLIADRFNESKSAIRFQDAALMDKPVIASRVGDFRNLVRHGETGWLTDNAHWADALETAFAQRSAWPEIGRRARESVLAGYATDVYAGQMAPELWKELTG